MHTIFSKAAATLTSSALILAMAFSSFADNLVTVPIGTIIPLRMESHLSSRSSQIGDSFTATVIRDVEIDGPSVIAGNDRQLVIPAGSRVEGHVTAADRAERMSRSGMIAITFDRLIFPGGTSIPIDGTLTSLEGEQKEDFEDIDDDDRMEGDSQKRRAIVFIGAGAGVGAVIGAVMKGGKGAAVGAGVGAALGTIAILLRKGEEAEVSPGMEFGLRVERRFTVDTEAAGVPHNRARGDERYYGDGRLTDDHQHGVVPINLSSQTIRAAQIALKERGYYKGPISGEMTRSMRRALRRFQRASRLDVSGRLDPATTLELGIDSTSGKMQH